MGESDPLSGGVFTATPIAIISIRHIFAAHLGALLWCRRNPRPPATPFRASSPSSPDLGPRTTGCSGKVSTANSFASHTPVVGLEGVVLIRGGLAIYWLLSLDWLDLLENMGYAGSRIFILLINALFLLRFAYTMTY